jgi:hypothetical protein
MKLTSRINICLKREGDKVFSGCLNNLSTVFEVLTAIKPDNCWKWNLPIIYSYYYDTTLLLSVEILEDLAVDSFMAY